MPRPRLRAVFVIGAPGMLLASCAALSGVDFDRVVVRTSDGGMTTTPREDGSVGDETEGTDAATEGKPNPCAPEAVLCAGRCGTFLDSCGSHACADCPMGQNCGAGGPNVCGVGTCKPECQGKVCGESDGCSQSCVTPCAMGQRCTKNGCFCDTTSCSSGCCEGDILGKCQLGTTDPVCGAGGAACTACTADRPCAAGTCKMTPHFIPCEQVSAGTNCKSICTFHGLQCSPSCANTLTGMGTVSAFTFENGACTIGVGPITGLISCADSFPGGSQSASCCCE